MTLKALPGTAGLQFCWELGRIALHGAQMQVREDADQQGAKTQATSQAHEK